MNRLRPLVASCVLALTATVAGTTVPTAGAAETTGTTGASSAAPSGASSAAPSAAPSAAKPKRPHVNWAAKSFVAGAKLRAKGIVPGKRTVRLQVKTPGRWKTLKATRSNRKGRFNVSAKLDWYGKHKVRVHAAGRRPFVRATRVRVLTPYAPRGSKKDYKFLRGRGLHWSFNPCQTLRYKVNTDDVGPIGIEMAQIAMAQAASATGIRVKYTGTTHVIPFQKRRTKLPRRTNLVIAWADETEVPDFVTRQAAGFGGPIQSVFARTARGKKVWMTRTAGVVLNDRWFYNGAYAQSYHSAQPTFGEIVIHEVGHALGLAHVPKAPDEIMYPTNNLPWPDGLHHGWYAAGDLNGLQKLGLSQGCVRKAYSRTGTFRTGPVPPPEAYHLGVEARAVAD